VLFVPQIRSRELRMPVLIVFVVPAQVVHVLNKEGLAMGMVHMSLFNVRRCARIF
jgi:hypothetical protein